MNWESQFIALFLASLFRPLIVAAAAFLVLRLFRIEHPAIQHAVWMAVLLAMVVVPVTSVVIPHFDFAVLPPDEAAVSDVAQTRSAVNAQGEIEMDPLLLLRPKEQRAEQSLAANPQSASPSGTQKSGWANVLQLPGIRVTVLLWIYLLGLVAMLGYYAAGWIMLRRVMARSKRGSASPLRESEDVVIPAAVGLLRPAVLLPRDWREWDAATRRAVLSHEFAHIRRRDPLTSALARFTRCLLWFHPLAWWTSRKVSQLAEMACDAAVVERMHDPAAYSRMLVDFARRVNRAGYRVSLPGLAMVGSSGLGRRINGVFAASTSDRRRPVFPKAILAFAGAPILFFAATLGLTESLATPNPQLNNVTTVVLQPQPAAEPHPEPSPQASINMRSALDQFCIRCHTQQLSAAGFNLDPVDVNNIGANSEAWERVLRKLRARTHPPMGMAQPDRATVDGMIALLEKGLDDAQRSLPAQGASGNTIELNLEIASRLSNFLWSSTPDDRLIQLASAGRLRDQANIESEIKRMLADPKSKAFVTNFFGPMLSQPNLAALKPSTRYPEFDQSLVDAFRQETNLFLENQLAEDHSVIDLLTANYSFINERLANHYGIPNVFGSAFQRITFSDDRRAGILGHGSLLTILSGAENGAPSRTSPIVRGKWVLNHILGVPAPDPPPNVPALPDDPTIPVRVRMEKHVANPRCMSCHVITDPIGYALENFNAVGRWQDTDAGSAIDASGSFPDGTAFNGPAELRRALLERRDAYLNRMTERLLAYALRRNPWLRGVGYAEMPVVRSIVREAASSDYRWSALVTAIAKSAPFQAR